MEKIFDDGIRMPLSAANMATLVRRIKTSRYEYGTCAIFGTHKQSFAVAEFTVAE